MSFLPTDRVAIVAELSCNHAGDQNKLTALIEAAKKAGADAVKLQIYEPDELAVRSDNPAHVLRGDGPWKGRRLWELYEEARTPLDWWAHARRVADAVGIRIFASAFSPATVVKLDAMGCQAFKVASAEVGDPDLVRAVAQTGKPAILSDGMATREQLNRAIYTFTSSQGRPVTILRCVSAYPANAEDYDLTGITRLRELYGCRVGLSDHTLGSVTAVAAVALGSTVIEKHLMLFHSEYGHVPLDAEHSEDPAGFAGLVRDVRKVEAALKGNGKVGRDASAGSQWRRRTVLIRDIKVGEVITLKDVRSARCGVGIETSEVRRVLTGGRRLARALRAGDPLTWADLP